MNQETTKTQGYSSALLVHGAKWELRETTIMLEPGLSLNRLEGTQVERLYHKLCRENGIDQGDPYLYRVFVLREPPAIDLLDSSDLTSMVQRVATLLAIITDNAPGMSRLINSIDGFRSCEDTELLSEYGEQTEFISGLVGIREEAAEEIVAAWRVLQAMSDGPGRERLTNALAYFYDACRAPTLDTIGVKLSLALEMLLGSTPKDDAGDQIAAAVSRLLHEADSQRDIEVVRKLYDFRSRLFSRGTIENHEDTVMDAFSVIARAIRKVLLNGQTTRTVPRS